MTAPHERHDPDHGAPSADPLMAAVAGEPLTGAQRADAGFMARYDEAAADVAVLREQLGLIAGALTGSAPAGSTSAGSVPAGEPAQPSGLRYVRPRRRRSFTAALALGALAVAAVVAVLSGMAWLLTQAGGSSGSTAAAGDSKAADSAAGAEAGGRGAGADGSPPYLACARLVVEGDVTAVRPEGGASGRYRVTLHVTRAYQPAEVPDRVTVVTDASAEPRPRTGLHVLVGVTGTSATAVPDLWITGERRIADRRALLEAEAEATATPAPDPGCS
ncbi:hypothetical protein [Streptomyces sp. NPDC047000]|uniref:hypothetical protein n=1 Tax=Streptomyces sp. NPDC047000 TaxID=3155474 RepID=UPI0033C99C5C